MITVSSSATKEEITQKAIENLHRSFDQTFDQTFDQALGSPSYYPITNRQLVRIAAILIGFLQIAQAPRQSYIYIMKLLQHHINYQVRLCLLLIKAQDCPLDD